MSGLTRVSLPSHGLSGARERGLSRLLLGCGILPLLLGCVMAAGLWWFLNGVATTVKEEVFELSELALRAKDMQRSVVQVQQFLSDVSATRGQDGLDDGFKLADEYRNSFLKDLDALNALQDSGRLRVSPEVLVAMRQDFDAYYVAGVAMAHAYVDVGPSAGNPLMKPFDEASSVLQGRIEPFVEQQSAAMSTAIGDTAQRLGVLQVASVAACLLFGTLVAFVVWRLYLALVPPLRDAASTLQHIAAGDLTTAVRTGGIGEVGMLLRAVADMQKRLRSSLSLVTQSVQSIDHASAEVAVGNQDLSVRTEHTASNLQQAANSMEMIAGTINVTADSARTASQLATSASEVAHRGGDVMARVVSTMDDIEDSARRIADITGTIDGISFQTNILALNAAVEAARAGEQGRGFAVVAGEVRVLAQRSSDAAREIRQLISASVDKIGAGSGLVREAGGTMVDIVSSVQRVTDIINEINTAAAEQSIGIGQIGGAVAQLDQMTQQNAALVEQSAAAAATLQDQARQLATVVAMFKIAATQPPHAVSA
jgi:methyl-accepting chemotaxis protein